MIQFNQTYSGKVYSLLNGMLYNWNSDGRMAGASVQTGATVTVILTGYTTTTQSGTTMYQTTDGWYIDLADGWQQTGQSSVSGGSRWQAQLYVNGIIKNNKRILENNILCARYSGKLNAQEKQQLYILQSRMETRNNSLIQDGLCSDLKQSYPAGYAYLNNWLTGFMDNYQAGTAGVGSVALTIIVSAVVIAALSTAAYYAYRYYYQESEQDVKYSDELTKTLLAKLTPEEYEQLKQETAGMITRAKLFTKFNNWIWWAAGAAVLIGSIALARVMSNEE